MGMIKWTGFLCLCSTLAISCTRSNQVNPPKPADSTSVSLIIDTMKVYVLGPKENHYSVAKFKYDAHGRLIEIYSLETDTTSTGGLYPDTSSTIFNYPGSDSIPNYYIDWVSVNQNGHIHHYLTYDDQSRVIIDSPDGGLAYHYYYAQGYFYMQNQYFSDTSFMSGNNLSRYVMPFEKQLYSYSDYANPFYIPGLSNHIGSVFPTLLSESLYNQRINIYSSITTTVNYSWTTNSDGRVNYGVGTDEATGKPVEYYWFTYRK
jgi:YD repeat-containing protein